MTQIASKYFLHVKTSLLRHGLRWGGIGLMVGWILGLNSALGIDVYPNPEATNQFNPSNFHFYGVAFPIPNAPGAIVSSLTGDGIVLIDFPHPSQKPPDQFNASFNWDLTISDVGQGFSFNFGALTPQDIRSATNGAGGGLTMRFVSLKAAPKMGDLDGGQISVLWRGTVIAQTNSDIGVDSIWSSDFTHSCVVNYSTDGGLNVDVEHGGSIIRLVNGYKPQPGPEASWRFGFIGEAYTASVKALKITASEPVTVEPPLTNRLSLQDQVDSLPLTLNTLEKPDDYRILIDSSNPAVISTNDYQVLVPTPTTRVLQLTPRPGVIGASTITLKLDQGGGQPITTIGSYQHTIVKNVAPAISALGSVTVPQGTTAAIPFVVDSNFWPPERLIVEVRDWPTNLFQPTFLPISLGIVGSGTNRTLVLTPALGQLGSGTVVVQATDPSGGVSSSTLTLTVTSNRQPVAVLGSGTALALNQVNGGATQYAAENGAQLAVGTNFTVEAWVFPTSLSNALFSILVEFGQASQGHLCDFGFNGADVFLGTYSNDLSGQGSHKAPLNTWSHIAAVVQGRSVTLYVNGEVSLAGQLPAAPAIQPGPLYLGSSAPTRGYPFKGAIDEVRIWNVARTAQDLQTYMSKSVAADTPGLLRYFRFDEGLIHFDVSAGYVKRDGFSPGGQVRDSSLQNGRADLVNFPTFFPGVPIDAQVSVAQNTTTSWGLGSQVSGTNAWGTAGVAREIYFNSEGNDLANGLKLVQTYPDHPDYVQVFGTGLEVPPNGPVLYGERIRGYLLPPSTGNYTLAIASANESELWLSTDSNASNKRLIGSCPELGVGFRQFDFDPSQTANVTLTAGQRYYFEVLHQASDGHSGTPHLSVRWTLPDGKTETPIPPDRIQPVGSAPPNADIAFSLVESAAHGSITINQGRVTYTPLSNFFGSDGFAYNSSQAGMTSAVARVQLDVRSRDNRPVAGSIYGLRLDGVSAYLSTSANLDLSAQPFTIELWARQASTNLATEQVLVSHGQSGTTNLLTMGWRTDGKFQFTFNGSTLITPVAVSAANDWHLWAVTYDPATGLRQIIWDGQVLASDTLTNSYQGNGGLFVGSRFGTGSFFAGDIDEVQIWRQARSASDILQSQATPLVGNEGDLYAYYRLDEGNGLIAYDSSTTKTSNLRYHAAIEDNVAWIAGQPKFTSILVPRNSLGTKFFLPAFDPEGQPLSYQISGQPSHGLLTPDLSTPGLYTYKPFANFFGNDDLSYTVAAGERVSALTHLQLVVAFINIPPTISRIHDQEVEEEDPPLAVPFTIFDVDDPAAINLQLKVTSSNPALLPATNIVFSGSGTNRVATFLPIDGEIGVSSIQIEVTDGTDSDHTSFLFEVKPQLAFSVVNIGELAGKPYSIATAVNEAGQVAGYAASDSTEKNASAFYYTGFGENARVLPISTLGGTVGRAFGLNDSGSVIGEAATTLGATNAFSADPQKSVTTTNLGLLPGATRSTATAINNNGLIVGNAQLADGSYRAFTAGSSPIAALLFTNSFDNTWATAINAAGEIVGYARVAGSGVTNAFLHAADVTLDLGLPSGAAHALATAINDQGVVVANALFATGPSPQVAVFDEVDGWTVLGDMLGGGAAEARGINRFGQIVGRALTTNGDWHAFIYSSGKAYDLNGLLPGGTEWVIDDARAVNDQTQIAGSVFNPLKQTQAVLLFPASEIGRRVFRPDQTLGSLPQIDLIQGAGDDTAANSFFWSSFERKLYAIRPVVASIKWHTGVFQTYTNETQFGDTVIRQIFTNEVLLPTVSFNIWPKNPAIHIAHAPAQIQPSQPGFQYGFANLIYTTADGAAVDASTKVFNSPNEGYSVLQYLKTGGLPLNPSRQPNHFTVARTVMWNDPVFFKSDVPWNVGQPVTNDFHNDYPGLNGYIYFPNADYDGAGPDAAYSRTNRSGPILPVNANTNHDALVVIWYHQDRIGTAWPSLPVRYALQWPTNADTIVIASGQGSGLLDSGVFVNPQIYNQPNPNLPGFNPNEEHALLSGGTVFALRNDLNARINPKASEPFVLLKYHDLQTQTWHIKPYQVLLEKDPYHFAYSGLAGNELQPPLPISLLPLMTESNRAVSGPFWQDFQGKFYARAAGLDGGSAQINIHYFYPLQPDFYYDLDQNGTNDVSAGTPVAWLDRRPGGTLGVPIDVVYNISWPSNVPVLHVGQTLTTAQSGLPDVLDMANAQTVFDSLNSDGSKPLTASARLFDPLSPRFVALGNSFQFPSSIQRQNDPVTGYEVFPDLPFYLRVRFFHDPQNHRLGFRGYIYTPSDGGASATLVNVMSERERDQILALNTGGAGTFNDAVKKLYVKTRNPNDLDLDNDGLPDDTLLIGLTAVTVTNLNNQVVTNIVPEVLGGGPKALTAGQPLPPGTPGPRYVVIAENNDPSLGALPISLHVIRVDPSLYNDALELILPDNVLDERVTLRHSTDFAGQPNRFVFQWYYKVDAPNFNPSLVPLTDTNGTITNLEQWIPYPMKPSDGIGVNDITLGQGGESSLLTLSDSWFLTRYGIADANGNTNWSSWIGDPSAVGSPRAMFVPGWIKRVLAGINLFAQRSSDFLDHTVNTLANTIAEAGPRYEGDVALNPDKLDQFGLIEIYETVLHRGRNLSIDGSPPVDFEPADKALLLAAGKISDLYILLANEAFADAADPTIGLSTDSVQLGSVASSVFAFENQVDSLLEEELSLLRGRDDRSAGVGAAPVYNRLFWNFTGSDGEVAYVQTYDIQDENSDGFINALDAKIRYPQGHGDAWGHYLTAVTTYYDLLRNTNFTWIPRPEDTIVGGVPILVNYQDERRFARAAAAKAHAGAEIVDRTFRLNFLDDAAAQLQGFNDSDAKRAWGVPEWSRRAGTGAYFDWVVGNAILPPVDPDPTHTGIEKIDRTTVTELQQIVTEAETVQNEMDQADAGLNPLGLARGVVPFDLDPILLNTGFSRSTHFEQIYDRALQTLQNAVTTFNQANELSNALRQQQDSADNFSVSVSDQELDYRNRLIEIFGYPYAGDLGPGTPYAADYVGPDLQHWMYVDTLDVTPQNDPRSPTFTGLITNFRALVRDYGADFSPDTIKALDLNNTNAFIEVTYPVSAGDYGLIAPAAWGKRRAEGTLQTDLRNLVNAQTQIRQAATQYANHVAEIQQQVDLLRARFGLRAEQIRLLNAKEGTAITFNSLILAAKTVKIVSDGIGEDFNHLFDGLVRAVPGVLGLADDALAEVAASLLIAKGFAQSVPEKVAEGAEISENVLDFAKETAEVDIDRQMETNDQNFEVAQRAKELESLVREEAPLRLDLFNAQQAAIQAGRNLEATLTSGQRLIEQRTIFRKEAAGTIQAGRYRDLAFRVFRNDALQKYEAQFKLAARYVYLAATAYDYELNLGGTTGTSSFLSDIIRERNLGEMINGQPSVGRFGLASIMGRMSQNFAVLKSQLGLNNDRDERARLSLRTGALRILPPGVNNGSDASWKATLQQAMVTNLWDIPEFRRYCRPFASESAGPQPGLVLRFSSTISSGLNFFGQQLGPLDWSYDPSEFSTRIRSVAVWLSNYDAAGLAAAPRVYLVPVGADVLRSTDGDNFITRQWTVVDQRIPTPFPIGSNDLQNRDWIPQFDSLDGSFADIRKNSAFRAYVDATFDTNEFEESTRLVGRSVWNTRWVLIIPGAYLLGDANEGLARFMASVSDIKLYFQTYSQSGN